jgi:hypothetical protein
LFPFPFVQCLLAGLNCEVNTSLPQKIAKGCDFGRLGLRAKTLPKGNY